MYPQLVEYLQGVLSAQAGETAMTQRYIQVLEERQRQARMTRLHSARAEAIRARLAAQQGDTAAALAWLTRTPSPQDPVQYPYVNYHQRHLRPVLLRALGRTEEALLHYEALPWRGSRYPEETLWDLVHLAPFLFDKAEILEELGRSDEAAAHYSRFTELWQDAEPELQPRVEEARRRLGRLRGGTSD
jgi:tetratricopeptide (TPR) repeat protein